MIKSVHKAIQLLEILSYFYPQTVSLLDLSAKTGIDKSTCVHILNTLIADSLVEKKGHSKYCLGIGSFYLTRSGRYDADRLLTCRPIMKWLQKMTDETILISVLKNHDMYTIDYLENKHRPMLNTKQTIIVNQLYRNSSGRILLAHASPEDLQEIIRIHGFPPASHWKEFENTKELTETLERIRHKDWITGYNAAETGYYISYSAPLYDNGTVFAALGLATFREELIPSGSAEEHQLTKYLTRAAQEINRRLQFTKEKG